MTLKEYINKHGALNWQEAVKITIQICSAIDHAHKNNIVHRDIKPHNILMTKDGIAKVTDFGIARAVTSSTITMVGSTIGSVHYFSPEQARGGFIDEKSDLYSLGIAMYEMVTGKVPFDGDSPVAVALKHIQEQPVEPRKHVPSLPYGVNEIIMKAIQKEQGLRYQTATAMLADLNKVLNQPQGGFVNYEIDRSSQSTIRMPSVSSADMSNTDRMSTSKNNHYEAQKQKKKNTTAYWLAGITSVLIIAIAIFVTINLFNGNGGGKDANLIENYKGKKYEDIKADLDTKGFKVTPVYQESDIEKGTIIDQSIPPGTEYKDGKFTSLELTISSGPKLIPVPDVKNREYRDAQNKLESANLTVKTIEREYNNDISNDYVIRTEPAAGEQVKENTEITIIVSKGTEMKQATVPNLIGKTEAEAKKALSDAKLKLGKVLPEGVTNGIVNKQLPEGYSQDVVEGDSVTIWLTPQDAGASTSKEPVKEPATSTDTGTKTPPADSTQAAASSDTAQQVIP
jgi:serine/threonine-protein kinase